MSRNQYLLRGGGELKSKPLNIEGMLKSMLAKMKGMCIFRVIILLNTF